MNLYPFIEAEKADQDGNVAMACRLLELSRAAYYGWSEHRPTHRELSDAELCELIRTIHRDSRGTYGAPRVTVELRRQGHHVGKKRVARLMARLGLAGRCKRRWKKTTVRDPESEAAAVDLVRRVFGPGVHELDRVWCGDISYVRTWEGWCYLATVIDLASRRVVGFAVADHMRAELACEALRMALAQRRPPPGLVFHTDRGSQYTSGQFRELLDCHGVAQSLSGVGQCWDNAVAESFFGTLKEELVHRTVLPTRRHARLAIFEWIEVFHNLNASIRRLAISARPTTSAGGPSGTNSSSGIITLSVETGQPQCDCRTPDEFTLQLKRERPLLWCGGERFIVVSVSIHPAQSQPRQPCHGILPTIEPLEKGSHKEAQHSQC